MTGILRAVMLGEESGVSTVLKDFLFRQGLRRTQCVQNVSLIYDMLMNGQMPVVFIDDAPEINDGLVLYEAMRCYPGLELVPFFIFCSDSDSVLLKFGEALGARGVLTKPFNPSLVQSMLGPLLTPQIAGAHQRAVTASKATHAKEFETAIRALVALETTPSYRIGAGIKLARIFVTLSRFALAEKKLTEMIRQSPKDLRTLCEISDLFMRSNRYSEAMRIFTKLEQLDSRLTVKVWDHLHLLVALDDINGASRIVEKLMVNPGQRADAAAALVRIMEFMGLGHLSPLIARYFPQLAKKYPLVGSKEAS